MGFLDERYLLTSIEAEGIFKTITSLPIVDAHNHVEAEQIATDKGWNDIWEVEGQTDHYVWELMRRSGVPEEKITGSAPNREKWLALANIFPRLAGNPVYEWTHLDLRRRFGIEEVIGPRTGSAIWERTKELLSEARMRPRALLEEMNVEVLCTTDSPLSNLHWHQELHQSSPKVRVLPTWRLMKPCRLAPQSGRVSCTRSESEAVLISLHSLISWKRCLKPIDTLLLMVAYQATTASNDRKKQCYQQKPLLGYSIRLVKG